MGHRAKDIEPSLALRASLMLSMSLALRVSLVYSFNHGQQPNDARSANDGRRVNDSEANKHRERQRANIQHPSIHSLASGGSASGRGR